MEVTFILMVVLIAFLVLAGMVFLYLYGYNRYINKVLQKPQTKKKKMLPPHVLISFLPVLLLIVAIAAVALDVDFAPGQSRLATKAEILENARIGYEDMQSEISMSGDVAAVLSYPENLSEANLRIYINQDSNHPDYVFRYSGGHTSIERAAYLLECHDTYILASLNAFRIAEIRCANGTSYSVNPDSPFVLVIPDRSALQIQTEGRGSSYYDSTGIVVLDERGYEIDLTQKQWFEIRTLE